MSIATKLITAEEFDETDFKLAIELVRGEIVSLYGEDGRKRPGLVHGGVCANVGCSIGVWARESEFGFCTLMNGWIPTTDDPDSVRTADTTYYRMEKFPEGALPEAPTDIVPDLCVEVLSQFDDPVEMEAKAEEYLAAGVEEVWLVDPKLRAVSVKRSDSPTLQFNGDATITSRVLPGYSAPIASFFEGI